jgi:uncharacterized membrane protein
MLPRVLLVALVIAYAVYFSYLTLTRYAAFEARALDLGNLNQAVWNTAQGDWFHQTNQPGATNRLTLHVEPILIPISWLYWLHPGPEILLVLQAVIVALGALPAFALAKRILHSEWLALVFALAFLLSPAVQAANWLEFHPVTLAPTFLLATFYFLFAGQAGWFAFFAVLTAFCKEDMGLLIFMLGVYVGLALKRWRWAIPTIILGLGWSLFAVLVIQGGLGGNYHWGRYAYLGDTPGAILAALVTRPAFVFAQLAEANALGYIAQLTLPTAFLALLAPGALLLALPSFAINLLADFPPMHQVDSLIYAAPIAPFVIVAGIFGAARILRRADAAGRRPIAAAFIAVGLVIALFVAQSLYGYLPGGANYRLYEVSEHDRRAASIIGQIDPADALSSQDTLNPHVSGRRTSYIFPRVFDSEVGDADAVFVDVTGSAWPQHPNDLYATIQELMAGDYGVAAADDGYLLLRRGEMNRTIPEEFYRPWRVLDPSPTFTQAALFGDALELLGYDVTTDAHDELVVKLFWRARQPVAEALNFHVAFLDPNGVLLHDSQFYPPVATLWYPTTRWQPGETILVQTLPWTLDAEQFTLALAVYGGDDPQSNRLPVRGHQSSGIALDEGTLLRLGGFERSASGWRPIAPETGPAKMPLDVRLGDVIALTGAEVGPVNELEHTLPVTLFWQALRTPPADFTAFVHVLDASGEKVAQRDGTPQDALGPLPTSLWSDGQSVVDGRSIQLPTDLPSGEYHVIVGLYNPVSGARLPMSGVDAAPGDVVEIGMFSIR